MRAALCIAACALGMLCPSVASAAPAWLAAQDLSVASAFAGGAQVALDGNGNAIAVWSRFDGSNYIVQAAFRPVGGPWQPAQDLSAAGQDAFAAQVVLDGAGNAHAVWSRFDGSNNVVQASVRSPTSGIWSSPQDVSAAGAGANEPQLALDGAGNALAVWYRYDGSNNIVQASERSPTSGIWSSPQDLSLAGEDAWAPEVALNSAGSAVAVWYRGGIVQASARPAGGAWSSSPQDLSATGQNWLFPQVVLDESGNALAVWYGTDGSGFRVQASARPSGGAWSSPQDLSAAGQAALRPQVALNGAGNALAVWRRFNGSHYIAQAAARPAGGAWQLPAQDLSAAGADASPPQVALDPEGNALTVWLRPNGSNDIVQAAARPAGGVWGSPQDLSATGQDASSPQVALDGAANALAVWSRAGFVQAAPYDATSPVIRGLSVPASARAGTPAAFSVDAFDSWSALASPTWSFGDGATASGANVSHTYAAAGTYTVSVTQADSAANASSATRQIVVSPLPALTISNARVKEGNRGTKAMTFLVRLSAASSTPVTVGFKTQKGTARPRSDFVGRSGTLTFAPGQTLMKLVVKIKGDLRVEPHEKFKVPLLNSFGATLLDAEGVGTIRNND